jgi:hypothetical protein
MSLMNAYIDTATGEVFADSGVGDVDSGAAFGRGRSARLARRASRARGRAAKYEAMLADADESDADLEMPAARANLVESYRLAGAANLVQENQFDGLGFTTIAASGTGNLTDTLNRTFWAKSVILDSDDPSSIIVTGITVAGLPVNVGSQGIPLSLWSRDSTRFMQVIGRRPINVGQQFRINLQNIDAGSGHTVSGGLIGDELSPYMAQQALEKVLIDAALALSGVGG